MTEAHTPKLSNQPTTEQIWAWLEEVCDPEIPVVSVVDLGIIRDVLWSEDERELIVDLTTTYSGCPATGVIALDVEMALRHRGLEHVRIVQKLSPPWSSDWIKEDAREKLRQYGIAPPVGMTKGPPSIDRLLNKTVVVPCPRCGSQNTSRISEFGSTACKAQYRCVSCLEPFDYFKCV